MELGPLWIKESSDKPFDIVRNQYAWTNEYNVLFVDQPVGTGLSYADPRVPDPYVHSMDGKIYLTQTLPKIFMLLLMPCTMKGLVVSET